VPGPPKTLRRHSVSLHREGTFALRAASPRFSVLGPNCAPACVGPSPHALRPRLLPSPPTRQVPSISAAAHASHGLQSVRRPPPGINRCSPASERRRSLAPHLRTAACAVAVRRSNPPARARPNHSLKRGPATAGQLGPVGGTRYIFATRAKPSCRSGPLSSNVRRRRHAPPEPSAPWRT